MRRNRLAPIERLHDSISALARDPVLFTDCGVADSFEGRFELLTLHLTLVLRRLAQMPAPAADVAQELADLSFLRFDEALREIGIGDIGVPKRMRKLAKAFYGRAAAYGSALDNENHEELVETLRRNIFAGGEGDAEALAARVSALARGLSGQSLEALMESGPRALEPPKTAIGGSR